MFYALVLEEGLKFSSCVFTPSIGAEDLESLAGLKFNLSNEGVQMPNHLLLHSLNKDIARLVINEGDKVEEILVRMGGKHHTNI